jgi:hypothetical protein
MNHSIVAAIIAAGLCSMVATAQPSTQAAKQSAPQAAAVVQPNCTVDKIVFASAIESREPVGVNTVFDAALGKVCCWTKITCPQAPIEIKHVWYRNDMKLLEIPLNLGVSGGRIWSKKNVSPGTWKVEVVTGSGDLLAVDSVVVK